MYTLDIINVKGQPETVLVTKDRLIRDVAPNKVEREQLIKRVNDDPKYRRPNKQIIHVEPKTVIKEAVYLIEFNDAKADLKPVYRRKASSDLVVFADGTYDYNEVVSNEYNEQYFDFNEYRQALKLNK